MKRQFYQLEIRTLNGWEPTGFLLEGGFRQHLELVNKLQQFYPDHEVRIPRIAREEADVLIQQGASLWIAPNV